MLIDEDDVGVLRWDGLPGLAVDDQELRGIFVDGELLQLDGQRQFGEALLVGGTPFGHIGGSLELHTLHICTAERSGDQCGEEPDMREHRGNFSELEVVNLAQGYEPDNTRESCVDEDERPERQHSRQPEGINRTLVRSYLAREPHRNGKDRGVEERGDSCLDGEEEGKEAHPMT